MSVKSSLQQIYALLPRLIQRRALIKDIEQDIFRQEKGTTTYFPLDFYEIHNFIFPFSTGSRDPELVNYYFENLRHQLILLPPTALEFVSYFERNALQLDQIVGADAIGINEFLDSPELQEFREKLEGGEVNEIKNAYHELPHRFRSFIDLLRTDHVSAQTEESAQRFVEILDTKLVDLDRVVRDDIWEDFDEDVFTDALEIFNESRPELEKRIPNRTDALNLAITFALNNAYYTTEDGGDFFLLITHGGETRRIYSNFRWTNDPLYRLPRGTRIDKDHRYCAYRAFFEKSENPRAAITEYLGVLDELEGLQTQFEDFYRQRGRQYLYSLPADETEESAEIRDIETKLQQIENSIKSIDLDREIEKVSPFWDNEDQIAQLLEKLRGRQAARAILIDQIRANKTALRDVFERLEPVLRSPTVEIVDRDGYKEATIFLEYLDGLPFSETGSKAIHGFPGRIDHFNERIKVEVSIKEADGQKALELNQTYTLRVGLEWPGTPEQTTPDEMTFNISIQAQDIEVAPQRIERVKLKPNSGMVLKEFEMTPTLVGINELDIEICQELNRLCSIPMKFTVIGDKEPAYKNYYENLVYSYGNVDLLPVLEDIRVQIAVNRKYEVAIMCDSGSDHSASLEIEPADVARFNNLLQEAARGLAYVTDDAQDNTFSDEMRLSIQKLAEAGKYVYNSIFEKETRDFLADALEESNIIEISGTNLLLPWDLLYDRDPKDAVLDNFWGMRYRISRKIMSRGNYVSSKVQVGEKVRIGLVTDLSLDAVEKQELPFFEEYNKNDQKTYEISLAHLQPLDPEEIGSVDSFIEFWQNEFHIGHFACHAETYAEDPGSSCIRVTQDCRISQKDLVIKEFEVQSHPLFILNACHTGVVDPKSSTNMLQTFLRGGVRGVLATECDVPDSLAADFAEMLYTFLLEGKSLGFSLLLARWTLWKKKNNPIGLLYGMYAPSSTCLVRSE